MELIQNMKLPTCSICFERFAVSGKSTTPLLLHCSHPACESCIISEICKKNFVTCLVCKKVSSAVFSPEDRDIISQFPIDNNLCGIYFNKSTSILLESDTQICFLKPVKKKKDTSKSTLCSECEDAIADHLCKQCNAPYCSSCFEKVHSAARALRDHAVLQLTDTNIISELKITNCKEHVAHNLEFYCDQCDVTICSRCLLATHNGHKVEVLSETNKQYRDEVIKEYVRISNILRRLKASKKETKHLLSTSKQRDVSPLEVEINDHFLRLHGSLTLLQNKIANQIRAAQSTDSLNEISLTLNSSIEETKNILDLTESLLSNDKIGLVNYKNIITFLKTKENIPCFVVRDFVDNNITFTADQNIFKTIEEHCMLNLKEKMDYKLVSHNDLPANYVPEPTEIITCADVEETLAFKENEEFVDSLVVSKNSNGSFSLSKCNSDSSSVASVSSSVADIPNFDTHFDEIVPGCTVQVTISHLISPSDFYIHRLGITKKLSDLQKHLRMCSPKKQKRVCPQNAVKGGIFMIFEEEDNFWYRVRVMELKSFLEITVHFIDFGNTEVIAQNRLRAIPLSMKNTPPLALRCKLANCYPINGDSWDPQAVAVMTQITNSCADPVMISVLERTFHFYEVDMVRQSPSYSCNVADTLKFLSLAVASNMSVAHDSMTSTFKNRNMKTMPSKPAITQGSILEARMGHVVDPDHFYIIIKQGNNSFKKLADLKEDMRRAYNGRNHNILPMFNPKPGLYVAARFSGDKTWYRAEVIAIPDVKMVKVFYIDYGISEVLTWNNIKVLFSKFYKLPPQAHRCRLADVEPLGSEQWNERVSEILHTETMNIPLKAIVDSVRDDAISVVLYKPTREADICINALLVKYQVAISVGIGSTVVEFPKLYEMPKNENTFQCDISVEKQIKTTVNRKPAILQADVDNKYYIKTPNGCLKIQVDIKRIVDPGLFFITLCYVDSDIQVMEDNLQKFYENYNPPLETEEWKVDSRCAVKIHDKWYRAIIEEIRPDEDQISVYIPDEGITEIVEISNLRKLDNQFLAQRDGVSKCHLGGLLPSLDNWSKTSITEFEEFVKNNPGNLYITKMTQSEKKGNSLPVELFKRSLIPAGPLEPARDRWTSFNHYLRMVGLAKADNVTMWDVDGNIITEASKEEKDTVVSEAKLLQEILSTSFTTTDSLEVSESTQIDIPDIAVKWLPPEPVVALTFIGTPTYVDDDCNIYIQDFMRSTLVLPQICEDLTSKFENTLPTPYDLKWTPGDICAALYFVDKKWYRGLVKKVLNDEQVLIQFVDYGNIDPCSVETLRKKPSMTTVPIQATCFKLHTIAPVHPDGQWSREDLENMHSTVSTKNCRVELEIIADGYGVKRLIMGNGKDAIALWVANRWARYANEPLVEYLQKMNLKETEETQQEEDDNEDGPLEERESAEEEVSEGAEDNSNNLEELSGDLVADSKLSSYDGDEYSDEYSDKLSKRILHWSWLVSNDLELQSLCKYEPLEISEDIETLSVEMTAVLSETEVVVNIIETDNADISKSKNEFNDIFEIMQKDAASQPLIKQPYIYQMCCAQFSADNTWYRAFVLDELQNETLLIQYIDYGNVEILPAKQVHIIANEWVKPKAQSILCCLHDIEVNSTSLTRKEIMNKLSTCLSRDKLKAKIKIRSLVNVVELFYDDVLAYQSLIDEGIFIKSSP